VPKIDPVTLERWSRQWGFAMPVMPGWSAGEMVDHAAAGEIDLFWLVGGNFLETVPDPARSREALRRPRLRVHQDIVLSSSMLVDGPGDVLLLPAVTRYESEGGGTETTTERRIIFSPEIPGRRIGSAKPEWWVFRELMRRTYPERASQVGLADAAAIRREIGEAIPLYTGIENLAAKGDQIQWGGRVLYADGRYATADGKAHFAAVAIGRSPAMRVAEEVRESIFVVSTRRGKQFNSMIQRDVDPLTGFGREDILISQADLDRLSLRDGTSVVLRSAVGEFTGQVRVAAIKPGNLEVHWPEGNTLLSGSVLDPDSLEPDYNAVVTIERADAGASQGSTVS
jgi:predicted molibdopterin-dependent oxidoreductase YjgC